MSKICLLLVLLSIALCCSSSELWLYKDSSQRGTRRIVTGPTPSFKPIGMNDKVSSINAISGNWELYSHTSYEGNRMVIHENQRSNVDRNDHYSSARPACNYVEDPSKFKLKVWKDKNHQSASKEFLKDSSCLGSGWNDEISSVYAEFGDWELYQHTGFQGDRFLVYEGQWRNMDGFNNKVSSIRPLCSSYLKAAACQLEKIEVVDDGSTFARHEGTTIIGSAWAGACTGPVGTMNALSVSNTDTVEESFSLEVSESEEINWSMSTSVTVTSSGSLLGVGTDVDSSVTTGVGGSTTVGKSETTSYATSVSTSTANAATWTPPGSAILFAVVDRYVIDRSDTPVKMHMKCSDGSTEIKETTMQFNAVSYQSAHFYPFVGSYTAEACSANPGLHYCTKDVLQRYSSSDNFEGIYSNIHRDFEACFANGQGSIYV